MPMHACSPTPELQGAAELSERVPLRFYTVQPALLSPLLSPLQFGTMQGGGGGAGGTRLCVFAHAPVAAARPSGLARARGCLEVCFGLSQNRGEFKWFRTCKTKTANKDPSN